MFDRSTRNSRSSLKSTFRRSVASAGVAAGVANGWDRKNLVLDAAYDEYCQLLAAGSSFSTTEFVARFPTYRKSLMRLIDVHEAFGEVAESITEPWPELGDEFLGFRLLDHLGAGGMARVYLASEPALGDRLVAVKISIGGGYEAETLGRLSHANIVPVHSVQCEQGTELTAVCMPYLGSSTLADVLEATFGLGRPPQRGSEILEVLSDRERNPEFCEQQRNESPPSQLLQKGSYGESVIEMGAQLADALAYTAGHGVLHRDLKPSNILVTPSGRPMLLDFNLSFAANHEAPRQGGTLPYMSPEQICEVFRNQDRLLHCDARSDLFSLGVILYEMLTGKLPFGEPLRASPRQAADAYVAAQTRRALPIDADTMGLDSRTANVIHACLELSPADRPASPETLAVELRRYLGRNASMRRAAFRQRRKLLGIGAAALGLGAVAAFVTHKSEDERCFLAGVELLQQQRFPEAVKAFDTSLKLKPDVPRVLLARGIAYLSQDDFNEAAEDLARVYARNPNLFIGECLAYCHLRRNAYELALELYDELVPHSRGAHRAGLLTNQAYVLKQWVRGDAAAAFLALSEAIELSPDLQPALFLRSTFMLSTKTARHTSTALAKQDIDAALALGRDNWSLAYHAARIYLLHGAATGTDLDSEIEAFLHEAAQKGIPPQLLEHPDLAKFRIPPPPKGRPLQSVQQHELNLVAPDLRQIIQHVANS